MAYKNRHKKILHSVTDMFFCYLIDKQTYKQVGHARISSPVYMSIYCILEKDSSKTFVKNECVQK